MMTGTDGAIALKRNLGWLFFLLAVGFPSPGAGQVIEGHVRSEDEVPIEGVLVLALDSLGSAQSSWITGEEGVFRLTVPHPGSWLLRAERIGFGVAEKEVLVGEEGLSRIFIEMLTVPVAIEGLEVSVDQRCPGASSSPGVAELWREARNVLTSVRRSRNTGASRFQVSFNRRDYRTGGFLPEFLEHESTDTVVATGMVPMQSAPPDFLAREGFIVLTDDTASYYAPDADVLLSDQFLTGHCFHQEERDDGGPWVGLGFDPIDPSAMDIRGTFWLPTSPEVWPHIEFTWTNHPWKLMEVVSPVSRGLSVEPARLEGRVGGRVELSFLEDIGWIVHRWWMRWPLPIHLEEEWGGPPPGTYLGLIREWDVELIRVLQAESPPSGQQTPPTVRSDRGYGQGIHGRLLDDSTAAPVSGARIVLLSTEGEPRGLTFTDSLGAFFFPAEFGTYQLQAQRLGYQTTLSLPFQVSAVDTLTVDFFIGAEAIMLAPLIVRAPMVPGRELFVERMELGEGFFFTPEMVDSLRPRQHAGEIFRHAEDTRVRWTWGRHENGDTGPIPRVSTFVGDTCLHFVVDRAPVPPPFFESSVWGVPPLSEVTPENLVAIEVYRGWHEVPEDFQQHLLIRNRWERDAVRLINRKECGVVFIWTKDGW